jgi:hypothetical protein
MIQQSNFGQMELFERNQSSPEEKVLNAVPRIAKRMWRERHFIPECRQGQIVSLNAVRLERENLHELDQAS